MTNVDDVYFSTNVQYPAMPSNNGTCFRVFGGGNFISPLTFSWRGWIMFKFKPCPRKSSVALANSKLTHVYFEIGHFYCIENEYLMRVIYM